MLWFLSWAVLAMGTVRLPNNVYIIIQSELYYTTGHVTSWLFVDQLLLWQRMPWFPSACTCTALCYTNCTVLIIYEYSYVNMISYGAIWAKKLTWWTCALSFLSTLSSRCAKVRCGVVWQRVTCTDKARTPACHAAGWETMQCSISLK